MKIRKKTALIIICILIVQIIACNLLTPQKATEVDPDINATVAALVEATEAATLDPTQPVNPNKVAAADVYPASFATYNQQTVNLLDAFVGGYTLPITPNQVENYAAFESNLSDAQKAALAANGFVVADPASAPYMMNEFYAGYESIRYDNNPVFITTDSVFHVYHLVFDKMLRDLETTFFINTLKELTSMLLNASTEQYNQLKGSALEEAALRNIAFFGVAAMLLETGDAILPEAQALVDAELALINAAAGTKESPIWMYEGQAADMVLIEDYSQYVVRGHYTRSAELGKYFKAMMWYGRLSFRVKDALETQRALLITSAMRTTTNPAGETALTLWQNIYDPTVFIVGKADDLGIYEYGAIADEVFGENASLSAFADQALLQVFTETARQLPAPQVNSMWVWIWQDKTDVTQAFRFMGQRFTLDQYVFGQVMWRNVGTMDAPRDLPKALDFFAAQGSEMAMTLLEDMGETDYENYTTQMAKVQDEVATLELDSWTQNLYWSWLYALQPVFAKKGASFPAFMQTDAWQKKDLQTALSSWTELKHDTILYAKQVMAEMGGGFDDAPPPRGYVEPNPEAYARLLALAEMTRNGLAVRGLLDEITAGNLDNLTEKLVFLLDISQRELNGGQITEDEYWRIQFYGGWLESMTLAAADADPETGARDRLEDQKSPVVADVATGMGRVLEEGVGFPTYIYVILPDAPYRIAVGVVYTYYEFIVSPDQRMTDEAWREQLETETAPAQPDWTAEFIVP